MHGAQRFPLGVPLQFARNILHSLIEEQYSFSSICDARNSLERGDCHAIRVCPLANIYCFTKNIPCHQIPQPLLAILQDCGVFELLKMYLGSDTIGVIGACAVHAWPSKKGQQEKIVEHRDHNLGDRKTVNLLISVDGKELNTSFALGSHLVPGEGNSLANEDYSILPSLYSSWAEVLIFDAFIWHYQTPLRSKSKRDGALLVTFMSKKLFEVPSERENMLIDMQYPITNSFFSV